MTSYLKLPLDLTKRHFIVGDVHGMFGAFRRLLSMINYNPETDIIYSVGDLIDRGPDSYALVEFFNQDNTYAINGNHEMMAIYSDMTPLWLQNGGIQTLDSIRNENLTLDWLRTQLRKRPWAIDVGDAGTEKAFRIVHAEIPAEWNEDTFQDAMLCCDDPRNFHFYSLMWGRDVLTKYKETGFAPTFNPNRSGRNVFVGHSSVRQVITIGDMTYLDTTIYKSITMINALTMEVYSQPYGLP